MADDWLSFMAFKNWMQEQPWQGNSLDKDILRPWEKFYCQETSVFIPQWLNALCTESANRKSDLPLGVSRNPRSKP
ncbi:hypothetical protein ABL991_32505, partial [Pseudomonas aeruginosa]